MRKLTHLNTTTVFLALFLTIIQAEAQNKTNSVPNLIKQDESTPSAPDDIKKNTIEPKANSPWLNENSALIEWTKSLKKKDKATQKEKINDMLREVEFQEKIGNIDCAMEIIEQILMVDPKHTDARFTKARFLEKLKQYNESLEIFIRLMEEFPDDFSLKNNVAWIYATATDISVRNGEKALSLSRDALMRAPNNPHVWNTLSEAYYVTADYDKAVETAIIAVQKGISLKYAKVDLQKLARHLRKCRQAAITMSILD